MHLGKNGPIFCSSRSLCALIFNDGVESNGISTHKGSFMGYLRTMKGYLHD